MASRIPAAHESARRARKVRLDKEDTWNGERATTWRLGHIASLVQPKRANRWIQHLAEVEVERSTPSLALQNTVQNVQNPRRDRIPVSFEHSEGFEQQINAHTSGICAGL